MRRIYIIPVLLGLLWTTLLAALLAWNVQGERRHIMELAERQARAFFQQIVTTRAWNSAHGGVFMPMDETAQPNPYLSDDQRTVRTDTGLVLVKVNPAFMTRQIADITAESVGVRFRITSASPIRPENGPDQWEKETLGLLAPAQDRFELVPGPDGLVGLVGAGGSPGRGDQFRYMAPLVAEDSCRACHPGDLVGAIRGGISVSVPAGPLLASLDATLHKQATAYFIIWLVGLLGLGGSTWEISRKRERAEALSRTRSRFLANMSHDMRTPLTGIIGLSERLLKSGLDPKNERYAKLIVQSAGMLVEVVGDILDYSRLDSGRLELEPAPFDLREAVDRTVRIFAFAAEEKHLRFEAAIDPAVPRTLVGDEFRFRQVLANLLGNGVKFTESGYVRLTVTADLSDPKGGVVLRTVVEDSGVGIGPEHQESIFCSFTQADDSMSRRHAGSGLGLSIARQLARMMGGDVSVRSQPGQGSAFIFTARLAEAAGPDAETAAGSATIPAPAAVPGPGAVLDSIPGSGPVPRGAAGTVPHPVRTGPGEGEPDLPGLRILVVDDHNANRVLLSDILQEAGSEVRLAGSGREALELFGREPFDAVLMDVQMPGMDGLETTRRLRTAERAAGRARTPVVVLTAFAGPEDGGAMPKEEVDAVLAKPIDVALLKRTILVVTGCRDRSGGTGPAAELAAEPCTDSALPAAAPAAPLVEPDGALKLLGGRRELYRILIGEFVDNVDELRAGIESAVSGNDRTTLARLAHTLKSSSATLGAHRLRDIAARLELQARDGEGISTELTDGLLGVLTQTVAALDVAALAC